MRLLLLLIAVLAPLQASAQSADRSKVDPVVVDRALAYLNGVRTLSASFVQRDQAGGRWSGAMWMERPGRLRFQYDPPENDVIWSSGGFVKHYDAELDAVTHVPRGMTPAWFLLDDQVRISDDVEVLATADIGGRYFITARQSGTFSDSRVTLAFQKSPDRLLGWTVTDESGAISQVDLQDLITGVEMPDDIFQYQPPVSATEQ